MMGLVAMAAGDVHGRVVNSRGEAVGYATVVAMSGDRQVAGTTSDEQGRFSLRVSKGEYKVIVEFVGYAPVERTLRVGENLDMGDVVLEEQATEIGNVVVSAQMIRREADRFVVDVANSTGAIGKDGVEVLKQSPGVWVDDDGISINGSREPRYISTTERCVCRVRSSCSMYVISVPRISRRSRSYRRRVPTTMPTRRAVC